MQASIHAILILLVTGLIVACSVGYGKKQLSIIRALTGLCMGLLAAFTLLILTAVGSDEGINAITLPLLLLIGNWAFWTFIESQGRIIGFSGLLFIIIFFLKLQYMGLAVTMRYTDNPAARLTWVRYYQNKGKYAKQPQVHIRSAWHTWLTQLYEVDPPAPGVAGFR